MLNVLFFFFWCSYIDFILLILLLRGMLVYIFISLYFWLDTSNITTRTKIPKRKYFKIEWKKKKKK